jgi:hypothetical protein
MPLIGNHNHHIPVFKWLKSKDNRMIKLSFFVVQ